MCSFIYRGHVCACVHVCGVTQKLSDTRGFPITTSLLFSSSLHIDWHCVGHAVAPEVGAITTALREQTRRGGERASDTYGEAAMWTNRYALEANEKREEF